MKTIASERGTEHTFAGRQLSLRGTHTTPSTLRRGTRRHSAVDGILCSQTVEHGGKGEEVRRTEGAHEMLVPLPRGLWIRAA